MMSADDSIPITLPSGLVVAISPLRMAEENKLAQAARTRGNFEEILNDVLESRVGAVYEPGPYPNLVAGDALKWDRLLTGDTFAAMIELRKISYDEGHIFTVLDLSCPGGQCPTFDYDIDLDTDVIRRNLDDVGKAHVQSGVPLDCVIDGRRVTFDLATGVSVKMVRKLDAQFPGRMMATRMRARIREVEGLELHEIIDWLDGANGKSKLFPGLRTSDSERLRDALDEHECGIDTEVELICEHCGRRYMIELPFDAGFLAPGTAIARRKRERRKRERRRGSTSSAF